MIFKASIIPTLSQPKNHRKPAVVRGLQWFLRFSQFYGEYTVRSPRARQIWLAQQRKITPSAR
ncbi:MAG: hypothetical protein HLUCCA11_05555 [Phormidesmis priestleyi Ana]|uniref:Uncharacterized protein n=1 Tax=Phormidesmis priestleyi Ana TaxID=1666911 RepID=A0A0P8A133_9CYAN|nr:MAG: hypothetical protein HLUCCA11_05555 [Phormidesmis priestleyi Ana]